MILKIPKEAIESEDNQKWMDAADFLYHAWRKQPFDKNSILVAGLEQWYYMTIYCPSTPGMIITDFEICMQRLAEISSFWQKNYPAEAPFLSLFGYCMKVQPFWFCLDSRKDDVELIKEKGQKMIDEAYRLSPDDAVICSIAARKSINRASLVREISQWDRSALRNYFMAVLSHSYQSD